MNIKFEFVFYWKCVQLEHSLVELFNNNFCNKSNNFKHERDLRSLNMIFAAWNIQAWPGIEPWLCDTRCNALSFELNKPTKGQANYLP